MKEEGQALTQLATHGVKLSEKAVVKAREFFFFFNAALLQTLHGLLIQEFYKSSRPVMRPLVLLGSRLSVTSWPCDPCTLRPN
jgi:hypothetical protein